ncbi:hypothetical protein BC835DRAFT_206872 [Cytidiella melzeri]|nr:hypothetical protein BC835DRAFT_206872 [Cytidiella melzeri]
MVAVTVPTLSVVSAPTLQAFNGLSISAAIYAALSALFGVYVVLFILALWSTYRKSDAASRLNRNVTIALFVTLLIHYISRGIIFGQSRLINPPKDLQYMSSEPLKLVTSITTTVAGLISDGLLAWRFYVMYGRKRWAFYGPLVALITNALLGLSGDCLYLSFYHDTANYNSITGFTIIAAWGWFTFAINTVLTGAIIGRILYMARNARMNGAVRLCGESPHNTVIALIAESGLVTWIGLVLYEITTFAPTGGVTTALNVGFVMICIIPIFFGISQCLLTVRLGLARSGLLDKNINCTLPLSNGTVGGSGEFGNKEISVTTSHNTSTSGNNNEKVYGVLNLTQADSM